MRTEIDWRVDENGMLLGLDVHDGHLMKLVASDTCLEFVMRGFSNEIFTVELSDLGEFNVRELWNGTIVAYFWVWKVHSVPEVTWSIPDSGWNVLFSNRITELGAKRRAAEKIAQARPEAFLVKFDSSYGGEVAAVCGRIRVFQDLAGDS
jgi:hypothetical protein